jgi:hypothetical protein
MVHKAVYVSEFDPNSFADEDVEEEEEGFDSEEEEEEEDASQGEE